MGKKLLFLVILLIAYLLPTPALAQCPTGLTISSDVGTSICEGAKVIFTASPTGGNSISYEWFINSASSGTGNSLSTTTLSNNDKVKVVASSSDDPTCSKTSNILTMTVNPVLTPSVSISASKTTICPGENITFTASPTNGGTSPSYVWKIGSTTQIGNTNTFSTTNLTDGQFVTVELTSNATCVSPTTVTSSPINITVKAGTPATPGLISGEPEVCPGISSLTYSIASVTNATSYEWTLPSGWSGNSTSNSITATSGNTGSGTITVKAKNDCGTSDIQTFSVNVLEKTPNTPGTITGKAQVCPGLTETYSIAAVSGATEYEWTLPGGWNGTSTTNSIDVTTGSSGNGNISVSAKNSCGTSAAKTLAVSVKPGTPAVPTTISGTVNICPGTTNTYSIAAVPNATSYEWTKPSGWTGTSSTTSITLTSDASGGNITVKALNDCGTSAEQTLAITMKAGTPATPSAISGSDIVCPGTSETYSVTNDPDASEYIWTLPNGWTGTSATSTISVTTAASGSGNITVKAKNDCGTSAPATISVSVKAPAPIMSGAITGESAVCHNATGLVYSIPAIANAETYTWSLPSGWSSSSDPGLVTTTNSITLNAGISDGSISVIAKNDCGDSAASANFAVTSTDSTPSTPIEIKSNLTANAICPPASGINFNIDSVTGATSYSWTLPSGWEITSGSGTNDIVVRVNASAASTNNAVVSVTADNLCGSSTSINLSAIAVASHVEVNAGVDQTVCKTTNSVNINGSYSFGTSNANLKPVWTTSGSGTFGSNTKLSTTYTPSSGDLGLGEITLTLTTDKPTGACSTSPSSDFMKIIFRPDPTATIAGDATICSGTSSDITFSATPNTTLTYNINGGTNQTIAIGNSGNATINSGTLTANATYNLVSIKYTNAPDCSKSISGSAVVTVTTKPTAAISYNTSPYSKCITTDQPVSLTGTGAYESGVFSAPAGLSLNTSSGAINPSLSTAGTYEVTYTTPASGGCSEVVATTEVVIIDIPTITLSYAGSPFCSDNASSALPTLDGTGNYQGGTYSSTSGLIINSETGAIDIASSTPETYTVTYSISPSSECTPIIQTAEVKITEKPQPIITYNAAEFCKSVSTSQSVSLTGTGVLTGGVYTSSPDGLNIDANGSVNPSMSAAGNYIITYSLDATNGCDAVSSETSITISDIPSVVISYEGPFCQSDTSLKEVSFSNTIGAYQDGTFSNTTGLTIDASTGKITPNSSQSGDHIVTYKIPASGGCSEVTVTTNVIITPQPATKITYNGPFCNSDANSYDVTFFETSGAYQNGTFSGTAGLSIDAISGKITPSSSQPGTHTIIYTIPTANGCQDVVSTTDIEIFEEVQITTQPTNLGICSTQPASFEVIASGDNLTYQWFKDNTAISGATSASYNLNNATSTNAGNYHVVVSGANSCSPVTSDVVTLNVDEEIIIIKPAEDLTFCENEKAEVTFEYEAHANGAALTFEWIKDGETLNIISGRHEVSATNPGEGEISYIGILKILNPNPSDNGVYAVKITGPDYFTCSAATSKSFILSVNDQPLAPEISDLTYCQGDVASALTATGTNLKWYGSETGDDLITGTPTPSTTEFGTTSYWVSQTPNQCESPRAELIVTVKEKPGVPTLAPNAKLSYCLNEVVTTPLEAVGDSGNTINWYNSADASTALSSAPIPNTTTDITTNYWVSQTKDGCESDRVQVSVIINPLPILSAEATGTVICFSTSTTLNATGATTYLWTIDGNPIEPAAESTKASPEVSPAVTTTYLVTGTSDQGCTSTAEVTVQVNEQSFGGVITPSSNAVCIAENSVTLSLTGSGYVGDILRWESSIDNGTTWTSIDNTSELLSISNLTQNTIYRAAIKSGVCEEVFSTTSEITVDPLPVAGELLFNGTDRIFLICENADPGYAVDLNLTGITGQVSAWQYRSSSANSWSTINGFTGTTLTADQIESLNISESTVFQVIVTSGACTQNALSKTAILSVIPTDITPSPVTVNPGVVCIGSPVTLNSETGYTSGSVISEGGDFDNAGIISDGWRFKNKKDPTDTGFDTDANNIQPDRWKRATPHPFTTASLNGPNYTTSLQTWGSGIEDGNKGFAIVSSDNDATMETPVFSIGAMDQAILTFDQAYNLTPGASIMVEISTDGGNTYSTVLYSKAPTEADTGITSGHLADFGLGTIEDRPENKIEVDLGNYLGQSNLRIRFSYVGARIGDVWAVDNIKIPEGPNGVEMEWNDYSNPDYPIYIGNNNSEQYTPTLIGWNEFEVKTKLIFDSEGNACEVAENSQTIKAFVFDTYTSTATANGGTCGDINIALNGEITSAIQGVITEFPTLDGYTAGTWEVVGPTDYVFSASHFTPSINDPKAIFSPNLPGDYTLTWTMTATSKDENGNLITNENCPPLYVPAIITIEDCTTLDFDGVDDFADLGTGYTGTYSIEAWIYPETSTGTIISGPSFEIKMQDLPATVVPNTRWYHIAVSNNNLYIDGIDAKTVISNVGGSRTLIGARWNTTGESENHYSGWIEEVRIWNVEISQEQIQFMMNQHLQNAGNMGVEIPMPVPGGLAYSNLAGYYRLISKAPDPLNLVIFDASLKPFNGYTPDLALNAVPGRLVNMTTNQENTAPLPYISANDGVWSSLNTWLRPTVWDYPNALGIDSGTPIDWNIARISHDISSGGKDITVLGLISDTAGKTLRIADPSGSQDETNGGQVLRVTHYLELDGNIDLVGESQLLQDEGSILAESSAGYLERDQQGTLSSFNYNYWTAPVSLQGAANNSGFTVGGVMWDGTNTDTPKAINYQPDHAAADGAKTDPITKSNYWIFKFANQLADDYDSWQHLGSNGLLKTGEGHTMKGVSGVGGVANINKTQNYVYRGKPNNGDITLTIDKERNYLVGNPYPSAIDAEEFILDNLSSTTVAGARNTKNIFDGTIYLWDHFSGATHILREYIGGYATLNLTGGAPAISTDDRILANNAKSTKTPKQFIPVSQGFFVNTGTYETESGGVPFNLDGGLITFKNSQRVFARETAGNSIFLKPENASKATKEEEKNSIPKIRVSFKSPKGYHRQLLVGAHPSTSNGFDLGYDAPMIEYNVEDMFWLQGSNYLVIQGVPDFGKDQILPLGVRIEKAGEFKIKIDSLENVGASQNVYLKDKLLDTIHDIKFDPYLSSAEPGEITDRFQLIFYKELSQDPVIEDPEIIDDLTDISLLHSYSQKEMMVLNPQELKISAIYLFDLNGKLLDVFDEIPSEKEIRLKVNNYSEGIYVLKMHADDQVVTRKIIIQK